jgi:hypothetical protein
VTEPLNPTGLWSYTSSDDTASHGRLSQLRRLLADELRLEQFHPDRKSRCKCVIPA